MTAPALGKQLTPAEWEVLRRHCERSVRNRLARMELPSDVIEKSLLSTVLKVVEKEAGGLEVRREHPRNGNRVTWRGKWESGH
jgi:hypothetical protein